MAGTFDISNFGDALFPVLAKWRLGDRIAGLTALSPTAERPVWSDSLPVRVLEEFHQADEPCDLVLLGGGDIVHLRATPPGFYDDGRCGRWTAYGRIWAGASMLAHTRGCPLAWNVPGVPEPLDDDLAGFLIAPGSPLRYLSVRDQPSRGHLPQAARDHAEVVPDSLVETAAMWPHDGALERDRGQVFRSLTGAPPPPAYVTIHVNNFATPADEPAAMATAVAGWCRAWDAEPVFVCPGLSHQDPRWIEPVQSALRSMGAAPGVALVVESSMRDLCSILAGSRAYAGSSMHGFIVSSSYGVPAVAVMTRDNPAHHKLRGHVELSGWTGGRLWSSWDALAADVGPGQGINPDRLRTEAAGYLTGHRPALDRHWQRMIDLLASPAAGAAGEPSAAGWLRTLPLWAPVCGQVAPRLAAEIGVDLWKDAQALPAVRAKLEQHKQKAARLRQRVERLKSEQDQLRRSWSWRLLRPLWKLERRLRRGGAKPADSGGGATA